MAVLESQTDNHLEPNLPAKGSFIPLIINGKDVQGEAHDRHYQLPPFHDTTTPSTTTFQGTNNAMTLAAIEAAQAAFPTWSQTSIPERRRLLNGLAKAIGDREQQIRRIIKEEIHCNDEFTYINHSCSISIIEETAAGLSSETVMGQIAPTVVRGAYPLIFNEPYGVILGIAPWNSPLVLGVRSICAAMAAGNTVVFKGSEFSPRTHYAIATLVRHVGFPPGVCNFILHRPEDAVETFNTLVSHPAIRKINFTGSTAVGRSIAIQAAKYIKPVILELGGKNVSIVLEDADLERAARESLNAAVENNGQVCMATDTILVHRSIAKPFTAKLRHCIDGLPRRSYHLISSRGRASVGKLVADCTANGGTTTFHYNESGSFEGNLHPMTLLEDLPSDSSYHTTESFGPLLAVHVIDEDEDVLKYINETGYGLSSAVFTTNHLLGINLARKMRVAAVHINSGSIHDEGSLPHGGVGNSGYGRFGGVWGLKEFMQTKNVMVYPD